MTPQEYLEFTRIYADEWHEVSDPIVWDGTKQSLNRILTALNGRAGWGGTNPLGDLRLVNPGTVGLIPLQGRIQIVGDSFVILPPEVEK